MSIVALKRKSQRFIVPVSINGFSLTGGHRNQRAMGDTNLSALNGQYNFCSGNDPTVVKPSVKNTKGFVYSSLLYPVCPAGCANGTTQPWVKNFSPDDHSQGTYIINNVKAGAAVCVTEKKDSGENNPCLPVCASRSYWMGGRRVYISFNAKNSGEYGQGALTAGDYISSGLLKYNSLPTPKTCLAPYKLPLSNSGCYHC